MSDMLAGAGSNQILTKAALAQDGGAVTTYSTTGTMVYNIKGKAYTKTAVTNGTTPTTDIATGAAFVGIKGGASVANAPGQGTVFIWMINAAGTVAVAQKVISPGFPQAYPLDMQANFAQPFGKPDWPAIPEGYVPFAVMTVKAGNTAAAGNGWVFGTNNWNATGITVSVQDIGTLPDRL